MYTFHYSKGQKMTNLGCGLILMIGLAAALFWLASTSTINLIYVLLVGVGALSGAWSLVRAMGGGDRTITINENDILFSGSPAPIENWTRPLLWSEISHAEITDKNITNEAVFRKVPGALIFYSKNDPKKELGYIPSIFSFENTKEIARIIGEKLVLDHNSI